MDAPDDDTPEGVGRALARRAAAACAVVAALMVAGAVISPLTDPASKATHPHGFSFAKADPGELAAEGFLVSIGGLRTLAADAAWLRAYVMWEKRDRGACAVYAKLAGALAPDSPYFREGYADWLAFDFPIWTIYSLGGPTKVPQSVQKEIVKSDARAALDYLGAEMRRAPDEYRYPAKAGSIVILKFDDAGLAADYDRIAAETPSHPAFYARRYVNWMADKNRLTEAVAWYEKYAASCPPGSARRAFAEEWLVPARAELKRRETGK